MFDDVYQRIMAGFRRAKGSHDADHTQRVLNMAMHIAESEHADTEVIRYAALLHDIGREEENASKGKLNHAEIGGEEAREILTAEQLEPEFVERVVQCIKTHSYRKAVPPQSLEAKILYDADKLDALGAIGIGRAFVFAGECGARCITKTSTSEIPVPIPGKTRPIGSIWSSCDMLRIH